MRSWDSPRFFLVSMKMIRFTRGFARKSNASRSSGFDSTSGRIPVARAWNTAVQSAGPTSVAWRRQRMPPMLCPTRTMPFFRSYFF